MLEQLCNLSQHRHLDFFVLVTVFSHKLPAKCKYQWINLFFANFKDNCVLIPPHFHLDLMNFVITSRIYYIEIEQLSLPPTIER